MAFHSAAPKVLVADDTETVRTLFAQLLGNEGYRVITACDGEEALAAAQAHRPDVFLLDVRMPGHDGLEVCRRLKSAPETRFAAVILVTGLADAADRIKGIEAGADDFLTKPVNAHELRARVRALARMKQLIDELDSAEAAFLTLALTIEARDPSTNGHCERLAHYAVQLGTALGLEETDINALHRGGYLHDVGKIGVPDAVLLKPGGLTADEMDIMRRHPLIGDTLIAPLQSLRNVRPIIKHHHEKLDGTGYPDRLRGDDVPLLARIVSIVDVYDALTTDRPYRAALTHAVAVQELEGGVRAGHYDPRCVEAFLDITAEPYVAFARAVRGAM